MSAAVITALVGRIHLLAKIALRPILDAVFLGLINIAILRIAVAAAAAARKSGSE